MLPVALDAIYSQTFNGSFPAFASWARFRDRDSGAAFRAINVHFEFSSRSNRQLSAQVVADRMARALAVRERVVLLGDVIARLGSATHGILEEAGWTFPPTQGATYHFNRGLNLFGAIDHIALAGPLEAAGVPVVLRQQFAAEWPADHYPVLADIHLH